MQITARKNNPYYLSFPMVDASSPSAFKTGISPSIAAYSKDTTGSWADLTLVATASEIGTTGIYEVNLAASEMNHDKVLLKIRGASVAETAYLFDTRIGLAENTDIYTQAACAIRVTPDWHVYLTASAASTVINHGKSEWCYLNLSSSYPDGYFIGWQAIIDPNADRIVRRVQSSLIISGCEQAINWLYSDASSYPSASTGEATLNEGTEIWLMPDNNEINLTHIDNTIAHSADGVMDVATRYWAQSSSSHDRHSVVMDGFSDLQHVKAPFVTTKYWFSGNSDGGRAGTASPVITLSDGHYIQTSGSLLLDTVVEDGWNIRKVINAIAAVLLGQSSGGGTETIVFNNMADSDYRVSASVDGNGNRLNIIVRAGSAGDNWI